jgi:hypothetical protein
VTPEMSRDMGIPEQLIGKDIKNSEAIGYSKAASSQLTPVMGRQGPAIVNKVTKDITKLGLGSPMENAVAVANQRLREATFERDTFGQWVSQDLAKKYPSLVSISDDGQTLGWKSPVSPTATIKTQGQQAQDIIKAMDEVKADIMAANRAGLLGPIEGRWNEFMVGNVGGENPQFAKLRSEISFLASGALKAHFGARGGTEMYDHFKNLFDSGKMSTGDLIGGIDGLGKFMQIYAGRIKTTGGGGTAAAPAAGSDKVSKLVGKYGGP